MSELIGQPITNLVSEFFDSTALGSSFLGQIAQSLITRTMSKYVENSKKENFTSTQLRSAFNKLSRKWSRQVLRDLSKLDMSENEKKLLLGLAIAALVSQVITPDRTPLGIDIAGK
jgi:hypothetical protein